MPISCVIGANRGIGLEFCKQLKDKGHEVFAFCRKATPELNQLGVTLIENCEVTDETSLKLATQALQPSSVDFLIHVAGIMRPTAYPDFDQAHILEQFKVNSLGPLLTLRQFEAFLKPGARISFLTSRMGSIADNDSGGSYGYRMSKAALNAAVKSLAIDLQNKGLTVLTLHPGWVRTDMTGGSGLIDTKESVEGLLKLIENCGPESTGKFYHTNGEELPW